MADVLSDGIPPSASALTTLPDADAFADGLRGEVILPGDAGYDSARRVWNGMIDRRPAMIVRPAGVADVVRTVSYVRDHDVLLAVRGGGHNITGNAVCDGGIVLDFSQRRGVRVDPVRHTARAEPGATWGDFDAEAEAFGLGSTGGVISTTGVAGLTLGGGVGWLVRKHGLSCDNLVSADVVLADGTLVTASADDHDDLFWGLRGGGPNFGVVTSLEFQLHPLGPVFGGMVLHAHDDAESVLRFYREFVPSAPEELTLYCGLLTSPDGLPVVALFGCYSGPPDRAEEVLAPVRGHGSPLADIFQPMPYTSMQQLLNDAFPSGARYHWKSDFLREIPDEAIDALVHGSTMRMSPMSALVLEWYGGAASRVPADATAFPHRDPQYNLVINGAWEDPADDERGRAWAQDVWRSMRPFSSGRVYVNALGTEGADRIHEAFGANYARLTEVKAKYDPHNLFRVNQNVPPTPALR